MYVIEELVVSELEGLFENGEGVGRLANGKQGSW